MARPRRFRERLRADRRKLQRQSRFDARGDRSAGRAPVPCAGPPHRRSRRHARTGGRAAPALHAALAARPGAQRRRSRFRRRAADAAISSTRCRATSAGAWAESAADPGAALAEALRAGDVVMVKGSNGIECTRSPRRSRPLRGARTAESRGNADADLARGSVPSFQPAECLPLHHLPRRRGHRDRARSSSSSSARRIIAALRLKQGKGQPIRIDGPQSHLAKKGTPTMGGLMILAGPRSRPCSGPIPAAPMSGSCCS